MSYIQELLVWPPHTKLEQSWGRITCQHQYSSKQVNLYIIYSTALLRFFKPSPVALVVFHQFHFHSFFSIEYRLGMLVWCPRCQQYSRPECLNHSSWPQPLSRRSHCTGLKSYFQYFTVQFSICFTNDAMSSVSEAGWAVFVPPLVDVALFIKLFPFVIKS